MEFDVNTVSRLATKLVRLCSEQNPLPYLGKPVVSTSQSDWCGAISRPVLTARQDGKLSVEIVSRRKSISHCGVDILSVRKRSLS